MSSRSGVPVARPGNWRWERRQFEVFKVGLDLPGERSAPGVLPLFLPGDNLVPLLPLSLAKGAAAISLDARLESLEPRLVVFVDIGGRLVVFLPCLAGVVS